MAAEAVEDSAYFAAALMAWLTREPQQVILILHLGGIG
jgi:hypothetical protein